MNGWVTLTSAAIVLGWVVFALTNLIVPAPLSLALGMITGFLCGFLMRRSVIVTGFIALMGPIGVVLPLLALRHVMAIFGLNMVAFSGVELLLFLLVYGAFLAASMGVLPVDIYRLGYAPLPVGVMVLVTCAYGVLSGHVFVPLVAVMGQLLWVKGWGSSNWFDHVLHAALLPVAVIVLVL